MKENKLADLSIEFAVEIVNLVRDLRSMHETVISNQIGRSGTSIGAIYMRLIMLRAKRILSQSSKLL